MSKYLSLALILCSTSCHLSLSEHTVKIDGVELEESHVEVVEPTLQEGDVLVVSSEMGDVLVEPSADSRTTLEVQLFELTPGDAYVVFENGRLESATKSGEPSGIGNVTIRTPGPLAGVSLSTGMGNVSIEAVSVTGRVSLSSGMGDVTMREAGEALEVSLITGMGDVVCGNTHCSTLEADTGMGDLQVTSVEATEATVTSGLGDVTVRSCAFGALSATTGLGDVECADTDVKEPVLHTGLGSTRLK